MELSIVIPIVNQFPLVRETLHFILTNAVTNPEVIVIDNGSEIPFECDDPRVRVIRNEKNTGNYPTFWQGFHESNGDVIAFFHSDLFIYEKGFDKRILMEFSEKPELGLAGVIGSNEIDTAGGRGLGTCSNFMGYQVGSWNGSKAEVHGKRQLGFSYAAVVDGCAMIFRADIFDKITAKDNFPLHHFYDRLFCCQVLEMGFDVGVIGIACDHISGQTSGTADAYNQVGKEWLTKAGIYQEGRGVDEQIYKEAERQWMEEYRPKGFIPYRVNK